jgi:hypothetical protein
VLDFWALVRPLHGSPDLTKTLKIPSQRHRDPRHLPRPAKADDKIKVTAENNMTAAAGLRRQILAGRNRPALRHQLCSRRLSSMATRGHSRLGVLRDPALEQTGEALEKKKKCARSRL